MATRRKLDYSVMAITCTGTVHIVEGDWDTVVHAAATYKMAHLLGNPLPIFSSVKLYIRYSKRGRTEVRHIEMRNLSVIDEEISRMKENGIREVIWG